jgi:hypothetical protein
LAAAGKCGWRLPKKRVSGSECRYEPWRNFRTRRSEGRPPGGQLVKPKQTQQASQMRANCSFYRSFFGGRRAQSIVVPHAPGGVALETRHGVRTTSGHHSQPSFQQLGRLTFRRARAHGPSRRTGVAFDRVPARQRNALCRMILGVGRRSVLPTWMPGLDSVLAHRRGLTAAEVVTSDARKEAGR